MKNKIFILGAIMGSFMLGSCGDFLEEESQSEVIPKTTSDFSELLLGTGYPDESAPNFSFLSLMDDDCAHFLTYASPWSPEGTVETANAITQFPIYSWQPTLADYDGYDSEINETGCLQQIFQNHLFINIPHGGTFNVLFRQIGNQPNRNS